MHRRHLLAAALAPVFGATAAQAQAPAFPITDLHSHYGMLERRMSDSGLAEEMRAQRVALVAWKLVADKPWIHGRDTGVEQFATPAPGELAAHFETQLGRMKAYVRDHGLKTVLTAADVDACIAGGDPGIVIASEGADFLEGRLDRLDAACAQGLRHLQLVHYIRTPVGDFQTAAPNHGGLSPFGRSLVEACEAKGVLVDLAHCTEAGVEQALDVAKAPPVWSHGWVDTWAGSWRETYGFQRRRLSTAAARKIAARGGVVGLWALGLVTPRAGWSVGRRDTAGYARELARLVDRIGADHVAFGTDIEGIGPSWAVNDYAGVRNVIDHLERLRLGAATIEKIAYRNHARVLKAALRG